MTAREMQETFDIYLQLAVPSAQIATKPDSDTIFKFLNKAQDTYIKSKYSGNNQEGQAVEQTQKRIDELKALVKEARLTITVGDGGVINKPNSYLATLPTDYMFALSEEASIFFSYNMGTTKRVGITECTADTYRAHIDNPYGEHRLHYESARPLRLFSGNKVELISDGNYSVTLYFVRYLKQPIEISLETGHDCELPVYLHEEIVSLAVGLFLGGTVQQDNQN